MKFVNLLKKLNFKLGAKMCPKKCERLSPFMKSCRKLLIESVPLVPKFSDDMQNYTVFGTQVEPWSLKIQRNRVINIDLICVFCKLCSWRAGMVYWWNTVTHPIGLSSNPSSKGVEKVWKSVWWICRLRSGSSTGSSLEVYVSN